MFLDTRNRTDKDEIMDDFAMKGEILREALDKIAKINQLLGGNKLTLDGIQKLISKANNPNQELTIVDVGCGNGDMLRQLADYGKNHHLNFKLLGIDANSFTIDYATNLSREYDNIYFRCEDIFEEAFNELKYDIVLCTLTLHHFKNQEIEQILSRFYTNSSLGIVINDLHRSSLAYRLFQLVAIVFNLNVMSREDGLTSILRGFKYEDLVAFSKKLNFNQYSIQWKWAFRYQWIISKI